MPRTAPKKGRERFGGPDERSAAGKVELRDHTSQDEALSAAVKLACDILKSDAASIALADEKGVLTSRTQHGFSRRFASRWRKRSSEGMTGIAFRTKSPCVATDVLTDKRYKGQAAAGARAARAVGGSAGGGERALPRPQPEAGSHQAMPVGAQAHHRRALQH